MENYKVKAAFVKLIAYLELTCTMLSLFEMVACGSNGDRRARNEAADARIASKLAFAWFRGHS